MTIGGAKARTLVQLIFRSIPDNSARFAELQAGTIQQADPWPRPTCRRRTPTPTLRSTSCPPLSTGYIAFQQCTEPFDKLEVRQAIAHAVTGRR